MLIPTSARRCCAQLPVQSWMLCTFSTLPVDAVRNFLSTLQGFLQAKLLRISCPLCKARAICSWLQLSPVGSHLLAFTCWSSSHLLVQLSPLGFTAHLLVKGKGAFCPTSNVLESTAMLTQALRRCTTMHIPFQGSLLDAVSISSC